MHLLPTVSTKGITVVINVPDSHTILEVIVRLALLRPVRVVVGGNRFDAHQLARIVRWHTTRVDETLARIQQARPFTCFQALTLLAETPPTMPLVVLDMLTPFYDENISDSESIRLVNLAIAHLQRVGGAAPVLVTHRSADGVTRSELINLVEAAADDVYHFDLPLETFQPTLWHK